MASSTANFAPGDDWRKKKELEEARKAGLAPAERDEDGKEINPHIPQYMAAAPWYLNATGPSLKHQQNWNEKAAGTKNWYDRGAKVFQADKFRKGACENCGSMTHKRKDCLERPRTKGAKWTGDEIAADDKVQQLYLDFEGKRDRWNGYDAAEYAKVVDKYEKVENLKIKIAKEKELNKKFQKQVGKAAEGPDGGEDGDDASDDEKINEEEMGDFGKVAKRVRTAGGGASGTVRNLRIREDTAKYLLNLDIRSAHYDPKTRSMREDPTPNIPKEDKFFAGDNFVRHTGDKQDFNKLSLFSMDAVDKGQEIHMQAAPSQAQYLHAAFQVKKQNLTSASKSSILDKYGDAASKEKLDDKLRLGQSESYVEYDRAGRVVKGAAPEMAKSRYTEDELINNHTSIWGSWWSQGMWGYACCHSLVKNSYCTGSAGLEAAKTSSALMQANLEQKEANDEEKRKNSKLAQPAKKVSWGTDVGTDEHKDLDPEKLKLAIQAEERRLKEHEETDERKRKYNVTATNDVTEEEMEAYRLSKRRDEDPMAGLGSGTGGYDLV